MTRLEKLTKWEEIYAKAMGVIKENLGVDKDHVYAACHTIQTASREICTVERVMRTLGELENGENIVVGWGSNPDIEAELLEMMGKADPRNANA